jgi:hypothetical protein
MSNATHNDGGPAFPQEADYIRNNSGGYDFKVDHHPGMTLRDYFAAAALQGILASTLYQQWAQGGEPKQVIIDSGKAAYAFAEGMLKAREESK